MTWDRSSLDAAGHRVRKLTIELSVTVTDLIKLTPRVWIVLVLAMLAVCSARERVILLPDEKGGDPGGVAHLAPSKEKPVWWTEPWTEAKLESQERATRGLISARSLLRDFGPLLRSLPPPPRSFLFYPSLDKGKPLDLSGLDLDPLLQEVAIRSAPEVVVVGHSDRVGRVEENDRLTLEKARTVRGLLIERGLAPDMVRAVGRGERDPLVPTPDEVQEPLNDRVELFVR